MAKRTVGDGEKKKLKGSDHCNGLNWKGRPGWIYETMDHPHP